jgi:hypothetical protein
MRNLITSLLFLLPNFIFSQVNIVNLSLIDSSLNIAYLGIENSIELIGYKGSNKLSYTTTNGTLTDQGQNRYVLRPAKEGECVISFNYNGKKIVSKIFKVESFPDPVMRFGGKYDSTAKDGFTRYVTYGNLISDPVLRIEMPNCYFKEPWKISSYRITLEGRGYDGAVEIIVSSSNPTSEQIQQIRNYRNLEFLTIDDIRVNGPDGRSRKLVSMIINVK